MIDKNESDLMHAGQQFSVSLENSGEIEPDFYFSDDIDLEDQSWSDNLNDRDEPPTSDVIPILSEEDDH